MKIREYILVKDKVNHPKLKEINNYNWKGNLAYVDEIHRMLTEVFLMDRLVTERFYVVALDHAKKIKGICLVGQGSANEVPTPIQSIFTFLMLTGANAFVAIHNHISDMPEPSLQDNINSNRMNMIAKICDIEFIGHMIINPNGYVIDGGSVGKVQIPENDNIDYCEGVDMSGYVEPEIEYLDNGMARVDLFGNIIEDKAEYIEKILGLNY